MRVIFVIKLTLFTSFISGTEYHNKLHTKHIYKCCPKGKIIGDVKKNCVAYNNIRTFSTIKVYDDNLYETGSSIEDKFTIIAAKFEHEEIKNNTTDITLLDYIPRVTLNGDLSLDTPNAYDRLITVPSENFCVDYRVMDGDDGNPRIWAIIPNTEFDSENNICFSGASLVSCLFLLLVLIVYILLPELQNLNGMILMSYVTSLFMAFLLLAIIQLVGMPSDLACVAVTTGFYLFMLASLCWMNVMSYDIWWTFRSYAKTRVRSSRRGDNSKFRMYCLYAWGVPVTMSINLVVLNQIDMSHLPWFVTPNIGTFGCFLEGGQQLVYLYCPMLILIIFNWIFYLMTAFNIWRLSRGTAILNSASAGSSQAHRRQKQRFMVYLKLSIVMGLNWLLEIVSYLKPGFKLWYLTDLYNILIGVFIFLIFICKRKIYRMLCKRYGGQEVRRWYPANKSNSHSSSSDSQDFAVPLRISSNPRGTPEHLNKMSTTMSTYGFD